ncbi:MAG: hypothetical protein ACLGGX_09755 [Bdellovibrionia bacterium]
MAKFKLLSLVVVISMSIMACGKKDSSFKARYSTNGSGARAVDSSRNEAAANYAQSYGLKNLDVINIQKQGSSGSVKVTSTIILNDTALDISTTHSGTQEVASSSPMNIGGYSVYVNTMCSNASCDLYFVMLTAYKAQTPVMQAGVMKYFADSSQDTYQWISGSGFVPFYGSTWYDTNTMIGILLTK